MTFHPSLRSLPRENTEYPWKRFPWRTPVNIPPHEDSFPLEIAVLCSCDTIYDERVGRCPRCADTPDHALRLITVLNRDGGEATKKEDN